MRPTRREFIQISTAAGAAALFLRGERAYAFSQSPALQKFIQPLRGVSLPPYTTPGIPVALPDSLSKPFVDHYSITVGQYTDQLHPALPGATRLWGYADAAHGGVHRHLGGIIIAQRGKPVQATFTNTLPSNHPLPIDTSLPGANQAKNRIAVHLHGGFIPWIGDGGPHDWFDPDGNHGLSFLNNSVKYPVTIRGGWQPGQAEYFWSMDLSARMLWYHDHAWGITRNNAYAGIATALLIRDPNGLEGQLVSQGLPGYIENGGREIPLVVQDKIFFDGSDTQYNVYVPSAVPGDLWYAYVYENDRWKYNQGRFIPPTPSNIPEFFGDTMLVNGTVYPTVTVEPRRYRFRLLNACNARFLNLQLLIQDNTVDGITLDSKTGLPTNPIGPPIIQIGAEAGFLPAPVTLNIGTAADLAFDPTTATGNLLLAPAERADFIIDFRGLAAGTKLILYSDSPAPFPQGDPRNDYYPGAPKNPTVTTPGFGPNTRQLMQLIIGPAASPEDPPLNLAGLKMEPAPLVPPGATVIDGVVQLPPGVPVRQLTINEDFDSFDRLIQRIGTNVALNSGTFARDYMDTPTEVIPAGSTEVWQFANLTGDTHPVHFHLVNVQIIARQPFEDSKYAGTPIFTGPARPPEPNEMGWKETVRMNPNEVTTVIMKFDLPVVPFRVPQSPRTGGYEYVYHCHILEHEEHDMMRPLVVMP